MVKLADLDVSDNHPLVLELTSLRNTITRFQDEAHTTSIKLQRHSLDAARAHDRLSLLQRENEVLRKEIAVLRAYPHPDASQDSHPAVSQVRQLTLSLRILSDKLSQTEEALLARTTALVDASNEAKKAKHAADGAYLLAAHVRRRDEEEMEKGRELQRKLEATEEKLKMTDLVVKEYAGLVRTLENRLAASRATIGRNSVSAARDTTSDTAYGHSGTSLSKSFEEGKFGLQRLLSEFSEESERQHAEIERLQGEVATSKIQLEAQNLSIEEEHIELGKTQAELQKLRMDDNTAAKMISRYMTFSQASSNSLQTSLSSLKTRHAATVDTLSTQISLLTTQLQDSNATVERLRSALDELGGDYMKEFYGRRWEVALRIQLLNREESLMERLRRWFLRGQEALAKTPNMSMQESLARMMNEAKSILLSTDGSLQDPPSGSVARIIAAHTAADNLAKELYAESAKRLNLQRTLALGRDEELKPAIGTNVNGYRETSTQCDTLTSSVGIQVSVLAEMGLSAVKGHEIATSSKMNHYHESSTQYDDAPSNVGIQVSSALQEAEPSAIESPHVISTASVLHHSGAISTYDIEEQFYSNGNSELTESREKLAKGQALQDADPVDLTATGSAARSSLPAAPNPTTKDADATVLSMSYPSQKGQADEAAVEHESSQRLSSVEPGVVSLSENGNAADTPEIVIVHVDDKPRPLLLSVDDQQKPELGNEVPQDTGLLVNLPSTLQDTTNVGSPLHNDDTVHPSPLNLSDPLPPSQHRLIALPAEVSHRYDEMQRAFHDCHLALDELKKSLFSTSSGHPISPDALNMALERLNDYVEDARVELEIRIADESLLSRGYETLLSVSSAMGFPTPTAAGGSVYLPSEVELEIKAFVHGTEPGIQKAQDSLTNKLFDVQHDIAVLKRVIHDQEDPSIQHPQLSPSFSPPLISTPASSEMNSGWKSWLRGPSSRPSSPAPTFGDVMTSPQLRHTPSVNFAGGPGHTTRKPYLYNGDSSRIDPLANLGFRVPMPHYVAYQVPNHPSPRSRTLPTMYMVGLGARAASGSLSPLLPPHHQIVESEPTTVDIENNIDGDMSDVE